MTFKGPFDILGFFLGYMSGPLTAESPEERQERMKRVVVLPERASTVRKAEKKLAKAQQALSRKKKKTCPNAGIPANAGPN